MFKYESKKHNIFLCVWLPLLLIIILFLTSCRNSGGTASGSAAPDSSNNKEYTKQIFAMDTYMTLSAYGMDAETAVKKAEEKINYLDKMWSVGNEKSEITKLNTNGKCVVSKETFNIISRASGITKSTNGAFDITIYPLMQVWGFIDKNFRIPSDIEIKSALELIGSRNIKFNEKKKYIKLGKGQQIDLGGIAKGYTSDMIMEIFKHNGIKSAAVSLGGNVHVLGLKTDGSKWKIGIRNPDENDDSVIGVVELTDKAAITSGGYERYFEKNGQRYHHIINPSDGYPTENGLKSVTVISSDGMLADALSTALYVMGADKAEEYWRKHYGDFDMVLVDDTNKIYITEGIERDFASESKVEIYRKKKY